ncbi:hypothetical protein CPB84DRAFT_446990 [Gymnopilus junonius]|uniref:Uncharacterized protein n=1 Tax=Gymnopilus junonius TaxID=109634 RepID=A0A9P5NAW8_GYMJU|nr:hypothetical protein CPB84DRAFT_446990 [Gymnopilus junonius]
MAVPFNEFSAFSPNHTMDDISASLYNALPLIQHSSARFDEQLASARLSRTEFFSELAPLFEEKGYTKQYAVCLVHRHFLLEEGERMVANNKSSAPTRDKSDNIIPERWLKTGEPFEYRVIDDVNPLSPPPSVDFFAKFKSVLDRFAIDVLGICAIPRDELPPGYWLLETQGIGERELLTNRVPFASDVKSTFHSSWVMEKGGTVLKYCYFPMHGCQVQCT